jgi:alpha-L-fucosidase
LAWFYNESPTRGTIVTNDRWGIETLGKHGDFYTAADNYNPGVLQPHKFENCIPLDKESWGYRENANLEDFLTIEELIREIVTTVSCNGNVLINVGPSSRGMIHPIFQDRLRALGK